MRKERSLVGTAAAGVLVAASMLTWLGAPPACAEEVKGRWRFDVQLGNVNPGGKIDSGSGRYETVREEGGRSFAVGDPRPVRNEGDYANSRGNGRIELHASYGFATRKTSEMVLDLGIGFYRQTIRGLELSYSFDSVDPDYKTMPGCETRIVRDGGIAPVNDLYGCTWFAGTNEIFPGTPQGQGKTWVEKPDIVSTYGLEQFKTESIEGGTLKALPLTVDLLFRYRPTKKFNPYIGGGLGYLLVRFDESARFREVADQLGGSLVAQVVGPVDAGDLGLRALASADYQLRRVQVDANHDGRIQNVPGSLEDYVVADKLGHRMIRPQISTPNTLFVQARAGVELQVSPRIALFGEGKFFWAKKDITITADGQTKFGDIVPNITVDKMLNGTLNPVVFPLGGKPVYIIDGGLRQASYSPTTGDLVDPGTGGQPGEYYLNGGVLKYGGFVFTLGVRIAL